MDKEEVFDLEIGTILEFSNLKEKSCREGRIENKGNRRLNTRSCVVGKMILICRQTDTLPP